MPIDKLPRACLIGIFLQFHVILPVFYLYSLTIFCSYRNTSKYVPEQKQASPKKEKQCQYPLFLTLLYLYILYCYSVFLISYHSISGHLYPALIILARSFSTLIPSFCAPFSILMLLSSTSEYIIWLPPRLSPSSLPF